MVLIPRKKICFETEGKRQLYLLRKKKRTNYITLLAQALYKKASLTCKMWVRIECTKKSQGGGIGDEPSSAKTHLAPARSFVNVVPRTHRKGLQRNHRGFVCCPYDAHMTSNNSRGHAYGIHAAPVC